MKKYPQIISKLFYEPMLITRARHHSICQVVEAHMAKVSNGEDVDPSPKPEYVSVEEAAIIPVHGVLVGHASDIPASSCGCGLDDVADMVDMALANPSVKTIIFDFNTPGGGVTGIPELARKIASITSKKTIGFTDSECCSGGMWLAMQCQEFYCTESASVGSIGVWCAYIDASKAYKMSGQKVQEFSAGKYKTMGASWKSLSTEEGAIIQASVNKIHGQFKEAINARREVVDEFMQGQIFDGQEGVDAGLVDDLVECLADVVESA